jgi:GABA permease
MQRPEAGPRRILVVANETVAGRGLADEIARRASEGPHEVLVIAPALTHRLRFLVSDIDTGLARAQERVDESVHALRARGVSVRGEVADSDPLLAIEDAIATFAPWEIVISTHPAGRSNWLEKKVVARARNRFEVPIDHIVVDLEKERAEQAVGGRAPSV